MIKVYPTLYSLTSTGKTQTWFIEQNKDKYRATYGQIDGKQTTDEWTTCGGKNIGKSNVSSPEEQCIKEIESLYTKKKKKKYFDDIKNIGKLTYFAPMLAKSWDDYKDNINWGVDKVLLQIKYNGGRMIARKEGLFTRTGEKLESMPHIESHLIPFFKENPDAILDGESFNYELRNKLNELMSIFRRTIHLTDEHFEKSKDLIRYYIYDGVNFGGIKMDTLYLERKEIIDKFFKKEYLSKEIIHYVPTWDIKNEQELNEIYASFLKDEQEGGIIRLNKGYKNGRSPNLLKYKPQSDDEFVIIDVLEGEGNRQGMAGKITCKMKNGETFNASMKGNEEQFAEVLKNKKKYIGLEVTICFNGYTNYGIPNFPRFDCNNYLKK